jgi:hypothetical protein
MVPVKSVKEYDRQLDVAVLFSECLTRFNILHINFENIHQFKSNENGLYYQGTN